jgi:hypothetical protein
VNSHSRAGPEVARCVFSLNRIDQREKEVRLSAWRHVARLLAVRDMNDQDSQRLLRILEELRDNQKVQLERQAEALVLQREQFALIQRQYERHERLQDRAEHLQGKHAQLVAGTRIALAITLPLITVLLLYLSWLIFR